MAEIGDQIQSPMLRIKWDLVVSQRSSQATVLLRLGENDDAGLPTWAGEGSKVYRPSNKVFEWVFYSHGRGVVAYTTEITDHPLQVETWRNAARVCDIFVGAELAEELSPSILKVLATKVQEPKMEKLRGILWQAAMKKLLELTTEKQLELVPAALAEMKEGSPEIASIGIQLFQDEVALRDQQLQSMTEKLEQLQQETLQKEGHLEQTKELYHEKEKKCEMQHKQLQSAADRFTHVAAAYPEVTAALNAIVAQCSMLDDLLNEDTALGEQAASSVTEKVKDWLPMPDFKVRGDALSRVASSSLKSLHENIVHLLDSQPDLLGSDLGIKLSSQLESLLECEESLFQQEDAQVQKIAQQFVWDLHAEMVKGGQELMLRLRDLTAQEEALTLQISTTSKSLSSGELLPEAAELETLRMKHTLEFLHLLRSKFEVGTSRGDALADLLDGKLVAFNEYQANINNHYVGMIEAEHAQAADAKEKQQLWEAHIAESTQACAENLEALETAQALLQQSQESGQLEKTLGFAINVERARIAYSRATAYQGQLAAAADIHMSQLQAQYAWAIEMQDRWGKGRDFMDKFAWWLCDLYKGMDMKAESTVVACREELPAVRAKFQQLQCAAQSDVRRRLRGI
eukprot:TRINITY_DN4694_c0_g1_i2.p1 TRINITY_DN4694_c0_g1~~TRINITY_DN4694_c0_g1_i2.p1  ORF type:complete len:664 (-),score=157.91 TRINITY_DN4694_c0_g1_i2:174-2063(-)